MAGEIEAAPPSVLLIGNYAPDRQESMQRFARTLAEHLPARGFPVQLLQPAPVLGRWRPGAHGIGKWLGYLDKLVLFPRVLTRAIHQARAGGGKLVVHVCDHSNAVYARLLREVPHLVTCNDLLAIRSARGEFPRHRTRWSGRILQRLILRGLRRARRVTCISHATAEDARRLLSGSAAHIDVTHMGLNHPYTPMPLPEARARVAALAGWSEPRPYLLHVGGEQWYKNRAGAVKIYAVLRAQLGESAPELLLAGSPPAGESAALLHSDRQLARHVHAVGEIDNETLRACYSVAELLLFPSLEEGFGWPMIEAQACGCRVLTTAKPPMNEVGGPAAFYLPAETLRDHAGAATILAAALDEAAPERARRIELGFENARGFSTERMIDAYAAIYRDLASAAP